MVGILSSFGGRLETLEKGIRPVHRKTVRLMRCACVASGTTLCSAASSLLPRGSSLIGSRAKDNINQVADKLDGVVYYYHTYPEVKEVLAKKPAEVDVCSVTALCSTHGVCSFNDS